MSNQKLLLLEQEVTRFIVQVEQTYLLASPELTERRGVPRVNVTIPVTVTPLDDEMRPLKYSVHAMTRDVSAKGVGFVSTDPVHCQHAILRFSPYRIKEVSFLSRVAYCKTVGHYFQLGCEFVTTN